MFFHKKISLNRSTFKRMRMKIVRTRHQSEIEPMRPSKMRFTISTSIFEGFVRKIMYVEIPKFHRSNGETVGCHLCHRL